tara:strand:- start:547 stop:981 length:435 start_codon:yes stop_codon:yes gene_type:complete
VAKTAVTVTKNFDLNRINLDLTKELNTSGQIVRKDHFQRLEQGLGVKGVLTPSKKATGKTLVRTGKMRNLVVDKATKAKQQVNIHPGEKQTYPNSNVTMSDVGSFHQEGAGNLPKREWFGITKKAEKDIIKMVELEIERQIKRA